MFEKIGAFFKRKQGRNRKRQNNELLDQTGYTYLVLHKTKNTPFEDEVNQDVTVKHLLPDIDDLQSIGYYDDLSEGLVLMTTDQDIDPHQLTTEFVVKLDKVIGTDLIRRLEEGVYILNTLIVPDYIEKIDARHFRIALKETMPNLVKRMVEAYGYHAIRIMKVRIETVDINHVKRRRFRYLNIKEVETIKSKRG